MNPRQPPSAGNGDEPVETHEENAARPARRHWLNPQRLVVYPAALLACYVLGPLVFLIRSWLHPAADHGPLAQDYLAFWSGSYLALHGHAIDAYNVPALTAVETTALTRSPGVLPWLYPPTFLLLVYPVALLPYWLSVVLFLAVTSAAFVRMASAIVPGRTAMLVALAFPGTGVVLLAGQNGLLTAVFMGVGLILLRRRPVLAGISFGLLCIKPHLAVLIPLALLCSRSWRALFATAVTALVMLGASIWAFGTDTLMAFVHNMGLIANYVDTGQSKLDRIPTFFSMLRLWHVPTAVAYGLQIVSACAGAAAVVYAWTRSCSDELRAATLVCASLMVSPYLFDYDLTWYGLVIAWFCRHALAAGFRRGEREWLVLLWLAPMAGIFAVPHLHFQFLPLVTAGSLVVLVRRIVFERSRAGVRNVGATELVAT